MVDYEKIEESFRKYHGYEKAFQESRKCGYDKVSEYVIEEYYNKKQSIPKISNKISFATKSLYQYFQKHLIPRPRGLPMNTISPEDSYEVIDTKLNINFYDEKLEIAKAHGYDSISEAVVTMYQESNRSAREISKLFNASNNWASYLLRRLQVPVVRKKGKLNKEQIQKIKEDFQSMKADNRTMKEYIETHCLNITPNTLKKAILS